MVVVQQPNRTSLRLELDEPLEIGRECDGLLIADPQASRRHAVLTPRGSDVLVEDLRSTNGTFLDGERIDMPVVLRAGSVVRIGDTTIELIRSADSGRTTIAPSGARETIVTSGDQTGATTAVRAASGAPAGARETSIDVVAKSLRGTSQLLGSQDYEGTITIVFSDIESSTEQATTLGDTAWMRVLNQHNEIVRRNVRRWQGHEVKNQGDGFMLTFPGARRALRCMIAVQQELASLEDNDNVDSVRIRVGVHTGEVIAEGDDIFGRHVMMAARVAGQAAGREILVSALVYEIASARGDLKFGSPRVVALKGIEGEHIVYSLEWEGFEADD
jgi:class 3 adenylate cyclase